MLLLLSLFLARLWVCGYCELILVDEDALWACVGIVGLFWTSLWACRYFGRRLLGYCMCGGTNSTLLFSVELKLQKEENGRFSSREAVDFWADDAVQQFFSVLVHWYDVLKTQKI